MRRAAVIELTEPERTTLTKWSRGKTMAARVVERANVILLAAQGLENKEIAQKLGLSAPMVGKWRSRFSLKRLAGIATDLPRSGRPPTARTSIKSEIVRKTIEELPSNGKKWSARSLAIAVGSNKATVQRIWHESGLKPHLTKTFNFHVEGQAVHQRLADIVGLYSNSDEQALVWACDSRNPGDLATSLPRTVEVILTSNEDRKIRSAALFTVIQSLAEKFSRPSTLPYRSQEWLRFLKKIDEQTPPGFDLYLIVNNYDTNSHPRIRKWLQSNQRFNISFIPEDASWLKVVDHWLNAVAGGQTPEEVFNSMNKMDLAIHDCLQSDMAGNTAENIAFQWVNGAACRKAGSGHHDVRP